MNPKCLPPFLAHKIPAGYYSKGHLFNQPDRVKEVKAKVVAVLGGPYQALIEFKSIEVDVKG